MARNKIRTSRVTGGVSTLENENPVINITFHEGGTYEYDCVHDLHLGEGDGREVTFVSNEPCFLRFYGDKVFEEVDPGEEIQLADSHEGITLTINDSLEEAETHWRAKLAKRIRTDPRIVVP